jgi:vancomycin resistance protein VanW
MAFVQGRVPPSLADMLAFEAKAAWFRGRRRVREWLSREAVLRHKRASELAGAPALASVSSPLWNVLGGEKDRALTAGKIQNLRAALRGIDGIEVPAGRVFSFWKQVGRATRRRGFVAGRELREGCLIANVGGGLCQLSNALFEAAEQAGFAIVERHGHSRVVPGSRAQLGRDATVFWNYVDLRFRSDRPFRIEARLTRTALEVVFRGAGPTPAIPTRPAAMPLPGTADDCTRCGQDRCVRHDPDLAPGQRSTAWLVDAPWPEFTALFAERGRPRDALLLPTRLGRRGSWPRSRAPEQTATLAALARMVAVRSKRQGAALQRVLLGADARLAAAYARRLSHLHTHLVVAQPLLPHLWRLGVLQGRTFEVLMERLPLDLLQQRLDDAARRHPDSPTLGDFRAPEAIVAAEREALAEAAVLHTPSAEIADLLAPRANHLPWAAARPMRARRGGRTILFPASALGRKGVHALREAIRDLDGIEVLVSGSGVETDGFFDGLPVRRLMSGESPAELAAVVLPAIVEHQPRAILAALAAGLPVIATPACGLGAREGLTSVPPDDAVSLREAIRQVLAR